MVPCALVSSSKGLPESGISSRTGNEVEAQLELSGVDSQDTFQGNFPVSDVLAANTVGAAGFSRSVGRASVTVWSSGSPGPSLP